MNVCDNIFGADFASFQTDTKTTDDDSIEYSVLLPLNQFCPNWPQHQKMILTR